MGRKTISRLQEKMRRLASFDNTLKTYKSVKPAKSKKLTGEEVYKLMPALTNYSKFFINNLSLWKCPSYNTDRQKTSLIRFLLFKYPVHDMFINAFLTTPKEINTFVQELFYWAIDLGQGRSIKDRVKGIFTAKELHWFLNGPKNNVFYNSWYAKCRARHWPTNLINSFANRLGPFPIHDWKEVAYWDKIIQFFTNYLEELDSDMLSELLDFIKYAHDYENFQIEGRTLSSLIRFSNRWHMGRRLTGKSIIEGTWMPMNIPTWEYYDKVTKIHWKIHQLLTGKDLAYESKIQHHCVWSYSQACVRGQSRIFTLHSIDGIGDERKHLTIEVSPQDKMVRQVRGKLNRRATNGERNILYKWIDQYKLIY
jgi:hypothetical protein